MPQMPDAESTENELGIEIALSPAKLIVAGWTGRDQEAVEHHIAELEEIGVKRPSQVPIFYLGSASRVVSSDAIEVLGDNTSGEVEFVLYQHDGALWVGVGSDHTDRELETHGVALSKQICDKPVGRMFWRYSDVAAHWDQIRIRSTVVTDGVRTVYQDGTVASMLSPEALLSLYSDDATLPENSLMFCGTVPVIGGIRPAARFECELVDPVKNRRLTMAYDVVALPVMS